MSQQQVNVVRFVEPDDDILKQKTTEVIEDQATIEVWRAHYSAIEWAVDNPGGLYLFVAFLPSLQMPAQRLDLYQAATAMLAHLKEEYVDHGPTDERTVLVRHPLSQEQAQSFGLVPPS